MKPTLLILEDGEEYLRFFSRHVTDYGYLQAHSHAEAVILLADADVAAFVLDLRFDRVDRADLIGDPEEVASQMFGGPEDLESAWRYIIDHQGYLILKALREAGHAQPALIIAELPPRQQDNLRRLYGAIGVVPSFEPGAITSALAGLLG